MHFTAFPPGSLCPSVVPAGELSSDIQEKRQPHQQDASRTEAVGLFLGNVLVANETANNHGNRGQANRLLQSRGKGAWLVSGLRGQGEGSGDGGGDRGLAGMGGGGGGDSFSLQDKITQKLGWSPGPAKPLQFPLLGFPPCCRAL